MPKNKKRARPAKPAPSPAPRRDIRTTPLDEPSREAIGLLGASSLILREALWFGERAMATTYVAARLHQETAAAARHAWTVASLVVGRTIGGQIETRSTRTDDRPALAASMLALAEACAELDIDVAVSRSTRARHDAAAVALEDAGTLLHEVAFEEYDASLFLATDRRGAQVAAWEAVPRQGTFVELLPSLFETADYFASQDPLLEIEVDGSAWWFSRWTARAMQRPDNAFATNARAQEWIFGDRSTLAGGKSILAMLATPPLSTMLPEKQKMLAAALARSQPGLYVVRERQGNHTTMEDIAGGGVFTVHEHSSSIDYRVGDIGAGRLIRVGDDLLRSPGMVLFTSPGGTDDFAKTIGPVFSKARTALYDATIAVEAMLALAVFGERVPRDPPPATSKRDAEARILELNDVFSDAGLCHEVPAAEVPPEMRAILAAGSGRKVIGYDIDQPLAEYAAALGAQARVRGGRSARRGK
jgi:hypothetical protein